MEKVEAGKRIGSKVKGWLILVSHKKSQTGVILVKI